MNPVANFIQSITPYAKAFVALLGAVATALLSVYGPDTSTGRVLVIVSLVATTILVYRVPNTVKQTPESTEPQALPTD